MTIKSVLKFIDNELLFIFAIMVFIALVAALGAASLILLLMLGNLIGIGEDIFIYVATFFILSGIWDALLLVVRKINDRNKRKKEREYFGRNTIDKNIRHDTTTFQRNC